MKTTNEEKQGMKAIIYLQTRVGKKEPEEKALAGWRAMTNRERAFTLEFYAMMHKADKKKGYVK